MPTFAQPVELHGDPTSLSIGADLNSILLRIPLEIWLHIFDGEIQVTDLTHLRSISKTFWAVAEGLMPHVAARMHPSHANDQQINDSFFAEALIAAHRLNVQSPLDTLLRRDSSLDSALPGASWLVSPQGPSSSAPPNADTTVTSAETKQAATHPTRADWIIGSRRMLHLAEARGRPAKFGICTTCKSGDCRLCLKRSDRLKKIEAGAQGTRPTTRGSSALFSRAILGEDALFCKECWIKDREYAACSDLILRCCTDLMSLHAAAKDTELRYTSPAGFEPQKALEGIVPVALGKSAKSCLPHRRRLWQQWSWRHYAAVYSGLQLMCLAIETRIVARIKEDERTVEQWRKDNKADASPTPAAIPRKPARKKRAKLDAPPSLEKIPETRKRKAETAFSKEGRKMGAASKTRKRTAASRFTKPDAIQDAAETMRRKNEEMTTASQQRAARVAARDARKNASG